MEQILIQEGLLDPAEIQAMTNRTYAEVLLKHWNQREPARRALADDIRRALDQEQVDRILRADW